MKELNTKKLILNMAKKKIDETIAYYESLLNNDLIFIKCKNLKTFEILLKNLIHLKKMQKINLNFYFNDKVTKEAFSHIPEKKENPTFNTNHYISSVIFGIIQREKAIKEQYEKLSQIISDKNSKEALIILINQQQLIIDKIINSIIPFIEKSTGMNIVLKGNHMENLIKTA